LAENEIRRSSIRVLRPVEREHHVPGERLIGRERELAQLTGALDELAKGRGRMFLISGEPGIGKTRLADELSARAQARGLRVIWGRCWQGGGAPAFWPIVQIIRACAERPDFAQLTEALGAGIEQVAALAPEIVRPAPTHEERAGSKQIDPERARFLLFDAVASLLTSLAQQEPFVLVLDDLHDADIATLQMLRFLASALKVSSILLIGTHREADVERSAELRSLFSELTREVSQIPLRGLSESEVADLVRNRSAVAPDERFVTTLHRTTGGNPLYLHGVVQMLAGEGNLEHQERLTASDLKLPANVRGAIQRQLSVLSERTNSVLVAAAALGIEFDLAPVGRVTAIPIREILDSLDEAAGARIIAAVPESRGHYRFTHALIRSAIYDSLGSKERIELHMRIADTLEELYSSNLDSHLAELAHHFVEAMPSLNADKAIDYSIRAGQAAYEVLAFEDAAFRWRAALALMQDSDTQRASLLERLGNPHLHGLEKSGIDYLKEALGIYEHLGNTESAARVQVNLGHMLRGASDLSLRDLTLALTYYRKAESLLSAIQKPRLLASLYIGLSDVAWELAHADEGFEASARAMEICERLGNELHWVGAATAHAYSLNSRGRQAEGFSLLDHAWQKADRLGNVAAASFAASQICYHHTLLWNPIEGEGWARRELARTRVAQAPALRKELVHCLAHAYLCTGKTLETKRLAAEAGCLFVEASVAFCYGDWEEAERLFYRDLEVQGQRTGRPVQEFFAMLGLARLHRASDRFSEAEILLQRALPIVDGQILHLEIDVRSELALLYGEKTDSKRAQPHLARIREIVGSRENWAGLLGHVARAEAVMAAGKQRFEDAQDHFESAVDIARRHQVPWDEAEAFFCWGRTNVSIEQYEAAVGKFDSAIEIYRRIGAAERWIDRASSMRSNAKADATQIKPPHIDATFHRDGDFWTVGIGTATGKIKDLRGMHYISHLLQHPGERIHVRDLAQVQRSVEREARSGSGGFVDKEFGRIGSSLNDLGDAGPILDSRALSAYKCRLDELGSELDEAETFNDAGRVALLREERESIGLQLRSAVARRGRIRTAGAHGERARSAVCKSIRFSLKRIAKLDPALGRFLDEGVHTGYECVYLPKNRFIWTF
jgi:predicted ATPase